MARSFHPCHNHFRRKPLQIFLQNCEIKSNRAGLGRANPNKVPEDNNSFLTDKAKLALSKFWPRNEQAKMNKCGTRRILLLMNSSHFCPCKQGKCGHTFALAAPCKCGITLPFCISKQGRLHELLKNPRRLPAADRKNLLVRCPKPRL